MAKGSKLKSKQRKLLDFLMSQKVEVERWWCTLLFDRGSPHSTWKFSNNRQSCCTPLHRWPRRPRRPRASRTAAARRSSPGTARTVSPPGPARCPAPRPRCTCWQSPPGPSRRRPLRSNPSQRTWRFARDGSCLLPTRLEIWPWCFFLLWSDTQ